MNRWIWVTGAGSTGVVKVDPDRFIGNMSPSRIQTSYQITKVQRPSTLCGPAVCGAWDTWASKMKSTCGKQAMAKVSRKEKVMARKVGRLVAITGRNGAVKLAAIQTKRRHPNATPNALGVKRPRRKWQK